MYVYRLVSPPESRAGTEVESVDLEEMTDELIHVRDAMLKVFDGIPARARGEVQSVEIGLVLTTRGNIAIPTEDMKPSLTLTLGTKPKASGTRSGASRAAAAKADVVQIEDASRP
jgi:hypothetical protein